MAKIQVSSGEIVSNTMVNYGGSMCISSGGVANSTTVNSGGEMYISSGGVADYTTVNSGAVMYISSGGTATNIGWNGIGSVVYYEDGATFSFADTISGVYFRDSSNPVTNNAFVHDNTSPMYIMPGGIANYTSQAANSIYVYTGGIANYTSQSGRAASMYVYMGGIANSSVITGKMMIRSGGVVNDTKVNLGGSMVISGGVANSTTMSGGFMYISSGGVANSTTHLHYSGRMYISSGGVASNTTASCGHMFICSGGIANSTILKGGNDYGGGGSMYIASGGVANSTTMSGGNMFISSGGVANSTTVNSLGRMHISSGGETSHTTLNSGGILWISSGGEANSTTVNSGGRMNISSGGTATDITVAEGGCLCITVASGTYIQGTYNDSVFEMKDASISDYTIHSGGSMTISSGGVANSTTVNSGGRMNISSGGVANSTTVNSGGEMYISSGGVANSTTVNSGGKTFISSGGVANCTTVNSGGVVWVISGGLANDTTVNSGGRMYIGNYHGGGVANSTTVNSGGYMEIFRGGVANNITVKSGGYMEVYSGGVANETTMSGGSMLVFNGGMANSTTVNSGGRMHISSGVASDTTVNSGGRMTISSGGVANETTLNGGSDYNNSAALYIASGGMANSTTVNSLGRMTISNCGVANNTTVNSGGRMTISSGGVANNTTVNSGGSMSIFSGGTATDIIWTPCEGYVYAEYGAYVTYVSQYSGVYFGANNQLLSSAMTMDNKVVSGGWLVPDDIVDGMLVYSFLGTMYIFSGGVANSTTVNYDGRVYITSGGVASNTTLNSGGSMYISSGGVANSTVVNSGGSMVISRGGTALEIIENGGYVSIENGANVTFCSNILNGLTLTNGATVHSGTVAIDTVVNNYGRIYIYSSGVANSTMVNSGGSMVISSGGVANSTIVNSGGGVWITSGGVANSTTVNPGGSMYISSGGMINGNLEIADGGKVTVYEGGIIDFSVAEQESADAALINDLSRITDNGAVYTLTVAEDQAFGNYILAGGATRFNETITVKTADTELGILVIGRDFVLDGIIYALKLIDNNLIFVMNDLTPPELDVTVSQKESLDYEFEVKISEPASLQYKIDNGEWQDADGTTIAIAQNGTYSIRAIDAAENVSSIFTKEINGLVFGNPEKLETDGGKTSWTPVKDESGNVQPLVVQYSVDNFKTVVTVVTTESALKLWSLPDNVQWRVKGKNDPEWEVGEEIAAEKNVSAPQKIESVADGVTDIFFARTAGRWTILHQARHQGIKGGWIGTQEIASLGGKSKIVDVFSGAADVDILYLTDQSNGDVLFVDDIYADSFEGIAKTQARIANLDEIRAGAGDDIVDMTSQRFNYIGDGVTIYGGDGDDVIWSNKGDNKLFGDAGNDHIVGASGNDVIVGGAGDDTLHGGGGDDVFCFGDDWGIDTVEQLSGGIVTLWFENGSEENWNADTRTYSDGENTVTVSGTADVTLKFGGDISSLPEGIFSNAVTKKIFESTLA